MQLLVNPLGGEMVLVYAVPVVHAESYVARCSGGACPAGYSPDPMNRRGCFTTVADPFADHFVEWNPAETYGW